MDENSESESRSRSSSSQSQHSGIKEEIDEMQTEANTPKQWENKYGNLQDWEFEGEMQLDKLLIWNDQENKQQGYIKLLGNNILRKQLIMRFKRITKLLDQEQFSTTIGSQRLRLMDDKLNLVEQLMNKSQQTFNDWNDQGVNFKVMDNTQSSSTQQETKWLYESLSLKSGQISKKVSQQQILMLNEESNRSDISKSSKLSEFELLQKIQEMQKGQLQADQTLMKSKQKKIEKEVKKQQIIGSCTEQIQAPKYNLDLATDQFFDNTIEQQFKVAPDDIRQYQAFRYDTFEIGKKFITLWINNRFSSEQQDEGSAFELQITLNKKITQLYLGVSAFQAYIVHKKKEICALIQDYVEKNGNKLNKELEKQQENCGKLQFAKDFEQYQKTINYGEDQQRCIQGSVNAILNGIKNNQEGNGKSNKTICITGGGGAGKSFCILSICATILKEQPKANIAILSLTHVALGNLRDDFVGKEGSWIDYVCKSINFDTLAKAQCSKLDVNDDFDRTNRKFIPSLIGMIKKFYKKDVVFIDEYSQLSKWESVFIMTICQYLGITLVFLGDNLQGLTPQQTFDHPKAFMDRWFLDNHNCDNLFLDVQFDGLFNDFWLMTYFNYQIWCQQGEMFVLKKQHRQSGSMLCFSQQLRKQVTSGCQFDRKLLDMMLLQGKDQFRKEENERRQSNKDKDGNDKEVQQPFDAMDEGFLKNEFNQLYNQTMSIDADLEVLPWTNDYLQITATKKQAYEVNKKIMSKQYVPKLNSDNMKCYSEDLGNKQSLAMMLHMYNYLCKMMNYQQGQQAMEYDQFVEFQRQSCLHSDFFRFNTVLQKKQKEFNSGTQLIMIPIDIAYHGEGTKITEYSLDLAKQDKRLIRFPSMIEQMIKDVKGDLVNEMTKEDSQSQDNSEFYKSMVDYLLLPPKLKDKNNIACFNDANTISKIPFNKWSNKNVLKKPKQIHKILDNCTIKCICIDQRQFDKCDKEQITTLLLYYMYQCYAKMFLLQTKFIQSPMDVNTNNNLQLVIDDARNKTEQLLMQHADSGQSCAIGDYKVVTEGQWDTVMGIVNNFQHKLTKPDSIKMQNWANQQLESQFKSQFNESFQPYEFLKEDKLSIFIRVLDGCCNSYGFLTIGKSITDKVLVPMRLSYSCNVDKVQGLNVRYVIMDCGHFTTKPKEMSNQTQMRKIHVGGTRAKQELLMKKPY